MLTIRMKTEIYLDYNATAPIRPGVEEAVLGALRVAGNPSSIHSFGRHARKTVETARAQVASLVGARPEKVTFNSGATEGNNSLLKAYHGQGICASAIEHPSMLGQDHDPQMIRVTPDGVIDLTHFEERISASPPPALVSVMMVNNETGVIQPVAEMIRLCHARGIKFHTDATQAAGRLPLDVFMLNADYMTLSSHKLGGPQGIGAMITTNDTPPPILLQGGGQERRYRAGTENVAGIAGFGQAAAHAQEHLPAFQELVAQQSYLEQELKGLHNELVIFGENAPRVANTTCCAFPGLSAETLLIAYDLDGIAISSGSACSSGKVTQSHVLKAMGCADHLAKGALRISTGWATTREDIDHFLTITQRILKRVR
ncbi:MAG: cysteine desulfurase [Rhodospirillales bacterium]|nr:cysteine desulfurase [Rhodospirillales bacterium]MCB9980635.1 cysteine desulfurase [Rhodospirillales bacterium]